MAAKFLECAEFAGWDRGRAESVVATVRDFETLASLEPLTAALRTA